jgi:DNA replication protein DnaC
MSLAQAKNLMSEMKFKGMLFKVERLLDEATQKSWSHSEFLDALLQSEHDYKKEVTIENKIKLSKLKLKPELEDFDYTAKRTISKTQVKDLYTLNWLQQGKPVVIIGQTGVGKTFLAQALGLHACRNNFASMFMDITTLIENLTLARASNSYLRFKDKITKPELLILDDFGLRKLSAVEAQDLCEILEARTMGKSTIITTQLPYKNWCEVISDPVIADAIIDRLIHCSITLEIKGESYRKIKASKLDKEKINS